MATYVEIYNLFDSANLFVRTTVAVLKVANYIVTTEDAAVTNHANRVIWAKAAMADPKAKAKELIWCVLANASVQASGEAALDSDIQWIVETNLNFFATGS